MDDSLLDVFTQFMEEHISEIIEQDEEFRAARQHEREIHDRFEKSLTSEQIEMFNDFIAAASEANANIERINYQQGMKDMFSLIKSLSK